ncbi:alpha/beta fold hydrolase [Brucella sp. 10RB9214]|uniref:alpha/beta fold hydrolase n=1 Tax=unclassified Brucella TaxID=2632610 RepID=UPI000972A8A2|nr:alpha/beta hydrolase [Brucella sp. 09RB8910]APY14627.1 alpha/beta hydrolase [Brucella sp. 09RB8910]MRN45747.1 alpha/beta fold hydrolase [Brucella sp. 10RB9212]MRN48393.1 alpha/beta fold hydrolase [Brucella sp. 10RB9214]
MSAFDIEYFEHDGLRLAYRQAGEGDPILLIHGFASSSLVNWVSPGWFRTLTEAGYRVIAIDNRGHGFSTKSHEAEDYTPSKMAGDAAALLDHLGIAKAHVMGYSMGARISAVLAIEHSERVHSAVFGGLGIGMVTGAGDWEPIGEALLAEDPAAITHPRGQMFRKFADQTRSDRIALAACVITSKELVPVAAIERILQPVLVAVGTADDIAGSAQELADLLPNGEALDIPGRDHMLAVGDKVYKQGVLKFLKENPL